MQRLRNPDASQWRCNIISNRAVITASQFCNSSVVLKLGVPEEKRRQQDINVEEDLEVDYVFTATGYLRNAHEDMLSEVRSLLPSDLVKEGKFPVSRDYRVQYDEEKVDARAGVWLQGCNEGTHGVTLNSFMKHFDSS
jgi:L-ornithine N5-oxygenase